MPVIEQSINLDIPVEVAYRYIINPAHLPEYCPNVDAVTDIRQINPWHTRFAMQFRMGGAHFEGRGDIKDIQYPYRADVYFWGGVVASAVWKLQRVNNGVWITVKVEYKLPAPLLRKHRRADLIRENEETVATMLANLKTVLEAQVAAQTV
jgi:hypothetical protein